MRASGGQGSFRATALREKRQALGLSVDELAVSAGVSPETVRRLEGGNRKPTAGVLKRLAVALGVTVEVLAPQTGPVTLSQLRARVGRTQREIAAGIGVSVQMVSRVERGHYGVRHPDRWAAAYQVTEEAWREAWQHGRDTRAAEAQRKARNEGRQRT